MGVKDFKKERNQQVKCLEREIMLKLWERDRKYVVWWNKDWAEPQHRTSHHPPNTILLWFTQVEESDWSRGIFSGSDLQQSREE